MSFKWRGGNAVAPKIVCHDVKAGFGGSAGEICECHCGSSATVELDYCTG